MKGKSGFRNVELAISVALWSGSLGRFMLVRCEKRATAPYWLIICAYLHSQPDHASGHSPDGSGQCRCYYSQIYIFGSLGMLEFVPFYNQ